MGDEHHEKRHVVVIGAGFTGLAAAYELARRGIKVTVLEKDNQIGGLAGSFEIDGHRIEKFYHHFFNNDEYVVKLAKELGCENELLQRETKTGMYLNNEIFKLSTPFDLLRFKPLSLIDRLKLGGLVLKARKIKDWKQLESVTAEEWLLQLCGPEVYRVIWEPLLRGKFGSFAPEISAVWFWNKLVLRGSSRSRTEKEVLAYYSSGFEALAERIADVIKSAGGVISTSAAVESLIVQNNHIKGVQTPNGAIYAEAVIATPALPIIADLVKPYVSNQYVAELRQIKYLANVCLVLELFHSLSDIYWLNVSDNDFPFIGVIEHTNFRAAQDYSGRHIVYMSKYFPETSEMYRMNEEQVFESSLLYIKRMFAKFDRSWVRNYHVWKARYAQPVVVRNYSSLVPSNETPIKGLYIATMAQIYPEDRGTNCAIREGRHIGQVVTKQLAGAEALM
jgi:protoporphyrinogen oxidase